MSDISKSSIDRLAMYLHYLKGKKDAGLTHISSVTIAEDMNINAVTVKKDFARIASQSGRPRIGFDIQVLIDDIQRGLGYNTLDKAVLVGVGQLGRVLLSYGGFANYGLEIVCGFDVDESRIGQIINGKRVYHLDQIGNICSRLNIQMGIITVPREFAQNVADVMIASGIRGLWNFAPMHINIPDTVVIKNEDLASSLAILSNKLRISLDAENK